MKVSASRSLYFSRALCCPNRDWPRKAVIFVFLITSKNKPVPLVGFSFAPTTKCQRTTLGRQKSIQIDYYGKQKHTWHSLSTHSCYTLKYLRISKEFNIYVDWKNHAGSCKDNWSYSVIIFISLNVTTPWELLLILPVNIPCLPWKLKKISIFFKV